MATTESTASSPSPASSSSPAPAPAQGSSAEKVAVPVGGGVVLGLRIMAQPDPAVPVVALLPAMALKAKFYVPLAKALFGAGLSVVLCDQRGYGDSTPGLREQPNFGYRELIEVDVPAVVTTIRARFPESALYLFGHSLGGQLALFHAASAPAGVAGIITIGTGTPYWRAFGRRNWLEAYWKIQTIGLVARLRGHWPGGMLIGGAMSGQVMVDWARQSRTSWCRPRGSSRRHDDALRALSLPVLAISLDDDRLGPASNVDFLCSRMPVARLTRWHVVAASGVENRDHFAWIKDSAVIGKAAATWIASGRLPAAATAGSGTSSTDGGGR
ncbi:alpha/beta hydrolase [Frankia sp. CcI49]|uniref:alpha/beta hydrolase family protein n=1 Tax=unclassified Frankia TaxID=2632575 RepID=UPI0006CA16DD|nr:MULTISPECIES: alpha/beta fold hydrolase [unclassified Frankia]KPM53923.1 alpha/beta hydrolase [Frankia sp. R43]ONH61875.1 alpha/beta hydrolase [Frankia sp. CcI49]